ncbi:MAG: methenyltetrahydromethanopterin cyclohydrolase [Candidatus Thorarchaeota archaeon]
MNENALAIVNDIIDKYEALNCSIIEHQNGTTIIDAGVEVDGGAEVGRLIGEACLGGLGAVRINETMVGDIVLPATIVSTRHPKIAVLGSQYAGWTLKVDDYFAMGSGPARSLACREKKLYDEIQYKDDAQVGVIMLESRTLPPEKVTEYIAEKCGISTSDLYCIVAPTACEAGSVQVAARVVEVGMHKLHALGFDSEKVLIGHGVAPIAPVAKNDKRAMGVTNDCILYAGRTYYFIRPSEEDDLADLVSKVPSDTSDQYGQPFYDLFKKYQFDFYKVDPLLFSPAEVTLNNIETGEVHKAGAINPEVLRQSLGL